LQRLRQPSHALAGPPQRRFRIPACRWFDQRLEIREQGRVLANRRLAPRPGRRIRSDGSSCANSFRPRPIVLGAMPVAIATAAMPPYPAANASAAATRRRPRSSRKGATVKNRSRMGSTSITTTIWYDKTVVNSISTLSEVDSIICGRAPRLDLLQERALSQRPHCHGLARARGGFAGNGFLSAFLYWGLRDVAKPRCEGLSTNTANWSGYQYNDLGEEPEPPPEVITIYQLKAVSIRDWPRPIYNYRWMPLIDSNDVMHEIYVFPGLVVDHKNMQENPRLSQKRPRADSTACALRRCRTGETRSHRQDTTWRRGSARDIGLCRAPFRVRNARERHRVDHEVACISSRTERAASGRH
jgi:hypothetical protein